MESQTQHHWPIVEKRKELKWWRNPFSSSPIWSSEPVAVFTPTSNNPRKSLPPQWATYMLWYSTMRGFAFFWALECFILPPKHSRSERAVLAAVEWSAEARGSVVIPWNVLSLSLMWAFVYVTACGGLRLPLKGALNKPAGVQCSNKQVQLLGCRFYWNYMYKHVVCILWLQPL